MVRTKKGMKKSKQSIEPIPMTQRDVDAVKKGGKAAKAFAMRLRSEVPTGLVGKAKSSKILPVSITRKELLNLRRYGKANTTVRARLERAGAADPTKTFRVKSKKEPTIPPRKRC